MLSNTIVIIFIIDNVATPTKHWIKKGFDHLKCQARVKSGFERIRF